jgi:NTP pyrophosphatase (non-canonical NTP hydrolase)
MDSSTPENNLICLEKFKNDMLLKLNLNNYKFHWKYLTINQLIYNLNLEIQELEESILENNFENAILECADIANFCMMISDNIKNMEKNSYE